MTLRALLLAAPGAGKGTQGTRLAEHYHVPHLATGDLLRKHVADGTSIGQTAQGFMDRGDLVPDALVLELVGTAIAGPPPLEGFVLDGFPRTLEQAESAFRWGQDRARTFHAVVSLRVGTDELVRRLLHRGAEAGRMDDNEVTIRARLDVYERLTEPLLAFYRDRGILVAVDGTGAVDEIFDRILTAIAPHVD
ncbi:MAG: adenylate kinase [Actinomycetota bacterium]